MLYIKDAYFILVILSTQVENETRRGAKQIELRAESVPSLPMKANLSAVAQTYLGKLGINNPEGEDASAKLIWMHPLAVGNPIAMVAERTAEERAGSEVSGYLGE